LSSTGVATAANAAANVILEITNRVPGITLTLLLYRLLQFLSFPLAFLYFAARLAIDRTYWSHFGERLGFLPRPFRRTNPGSIWLHAVSAGEIASAIPLIRNLRIARPQAPLYLSTSTVAGRIAAERQASSLVDGIFYSPLDYVSFVRRALRALRPALLIVIETEIWPHLYAEAKRSGARLVIVNGRISNRAWPRYRKLRLLMRPILRLPDRILVQSAKDRDRYIALGAPYEKVEVARNLKYDVPFAPAPLDLPTFGADHVWIAASTVGPNERGSLMRHAVDEDEIVLQTFDSLAAEFPRLLLILAPRQPARFDEVARKLSSKGIRFVRRSTPRPLRSASWGALELPAVLLLDTIGELSRTYLLAHAVFVGGSLAPRGGHNIIEPAACGAPVIVGPHMQNFEAITDDFLRADAIVQIHRPEELLPAVRALLLDRDRAEAMGERARQVVERQQGASPAIASRLWPLYYAAYLKPPRGFPARSILGFFALLWRTGGEIKRSRSRHHAAAQPSLHVPVVSIGGITVGGSGKTPFTTYIVDRLHRRGYSPAVLTRGYRRRSPAKTLVFAPGARVSPAFTGDEAQIFLRAGVAPIGIGANRYAAGKILLSQFPGTDVLLLDDGFQHARLHRDLDLVLIDGLDPFGQDAVLPSGRLREPLRALRRADAFVVTRAPVDLRYEAICARLREYNSTAPVFRTRLIARRWRDYRTGASMSALPARRVAAFCGLGNPQSFWSTLESLGLEVVFRWAFEDHHSYKPSDLQSIVHQARASRAEILVTTEKDRVNCPNQLEKAIDPYDLAWLEIELELEDEPAFFAFVQRTLARRAVA
jgi:tetraacyldisaccharide 4'-kinase